MTNKEKFLALVAEHDNSLLEEIESRIQKQKSLQRSKQVAIRILSRMDELNMSQKDLAEKLNLSPQQVNKWVKGNENFTFETIEKIENALDFELISINEASCASSSNKIVMDISNQKNFNNLEMKRTQSEAKIIPFESAFPCVTQKCKFG
ncbi:MAG: helix-turn-helix domain-containing protein [Bacteroidales bacterium]|nr:helix-turn-helix domain-containing protein [Bacteroidales bacterium]